MQNENTDLLNQMTEQVQETRDIVQEVFTGLDMAYKNLDRLSSDYSRIIGLAQAQLQHIIIYCNVLLSVSSTDKNVPTYVNNEIQRIKEMAERGNDLLNKRFKEAIEYKQ
jgi:hypothetical protein